MERTTNRSILNVLGMRSSKYGSIERFQVELAKELEQNGINLVVVYEHFPDSADYINDLRSHRARIMVIPSRGVKNIVPFLFSTFHLLIRSRPLVVHSHFDPAGYIALAAAKLLRIKTVRTLHGMLTFGTSNSNCTNRFQLSRRTRLLKMFMYSFTDRILSVSEAVKNQFNHVFAKGGKIERLYLGVQSFAHDKQECRVKYNLPRDKTIITCIAFHDPVKGIDVLLDAISVLTKGQNADNFVVCQVGCGEGTLQLKQRAKDLGIEKYVIWMGVQHKVSEILCASDIYVQPSRSEGLGLSLVEASFAKLPLVASAVGGIPEVVIEGITGFLFERENSGQLAEKLKTLMNNPRMAEKIGEAGYRYAKEHFSVESQARKLVEIYQRLVVF